MAASPGPEPGTAPAADRTTNLEAHVLAVVAGSEGSSAYQVMKALGSSLGGSLQISTGTMYPIVRRLRERGLLAATPSDASGRRAEGLACTEAGRREATAWLATLSAGDILPPDPLLAKIELLHLLEPRQRVRWLAGAGRAIEERLDRLRERLECDDEAGTRLLVRGAMATLEARRRWLQDVLLSIEL